MNYVILIGCILFDIVINCIISTWNMLILQQEAITQSLRFAENNTTYMTLHFNFYERNTKTHLASVDQKCASMKLSIINKLLSLPPSCCTFTTTRRRQTPPSLKMYSAPHFFKHNITHSQLATYSTKLASFS